MAAGWETHSPTKCYIYERFIGFLICGNNSHGSHATYSCWLRCRWENIHLLSPPPWWVWLTCLRFESSSYCQTFLCVSTGLVLGFGVLTQFEKVQQKATVMGFKAVTQLRSTFSLLLSLILCFLYCCRSLGSMLKTNIHVKMNCWTVKTNSEL